MDFLIPYFHTKKNLQKSDKIAKSPIKSRDIVPLYLLVKMKLLFEFYFYGWRRLDGMGIIFWEGLWVIDGRFDI